MDDLEELELMENEDVCMKCKVNASEEAHTCPYSEDVESDYDFTCNCCIDCEHECAMDV